MVEYPSSKDNWTNLTKSLKRLWVSFPYSADIKLSISGLLI